MTRHDAETALKQLDGSDWQGHMLKVGFALFVRRSNLKLQIRLIGENA